MGNVAAVRGNIIGIARDGVAEGASVGNRIG